jgi:hypothetical protein
VLSSDFPYSMEPNFGLTTRLKILTFFMWVAFVTYILTYMLMTINYDQMMYDHMNDRGVTWDYIRYFYNSLGMFAVLAMLFLLTHMLIGLAYLAAFITAVFCAGLHGVSWGFLFADLLSNCSNVAMCSFTLGNSTPDYSFIIHFVCVGTLAGCCIAFIVMTLILRTRVEFANMLALAADSRYNPMVSYFTPPGGFSSYPTWLGGTGGTNTAFMSSNIGAGMTSTNALFHPLPGPGANTLVEHPAAPQRLMGQNMMIRSPVDFDA